MKEDSVKSFNLKLITCTSASFNNVQIFVEGMCTYYFLILLKLLKKNGPKIVSFSGQKSISNERGITLISCSNYVIELSYSPF